MAFKVGEKYECTGKLFPYFKKGKRYKVDDVEAVEVAFINERGQKHWWRKDSVEAHFVKVNSSKDRISSLEKGMEQMYESFETLRKDYFHDIELLQERFQKKIASLEQTLTNFAEFRKSDKPEIIEFEGGKYRKVDRKATKDDIVAFKSNKHLPSYVKADKLYRVLINTTFLDEDEQAIPVYNEVTGRTFETVDVYEPIRQDVQRKTVTCGHHVPPYKSPNQQRAEIIEEAKEFIKLAGADNIEFAVSEKYRAVTAIWYKGIEVATATVKCEPDKVFNADIFKAIALGRVLGMDVAEFENAVQPSHYAVGQIGIAPNVGFDNKYRIDEIGTDQTLTKLFSDGGKAWANTTLPLNYEDGFQRALTIIDDTNAIYTEEAQ